MSMLKDIIWNMKKRIYDKSSREIFKTSLLEKDEEDLIEKYHPDDNEILKCLPPFRQESPNEIESINYTLYKLIGKDAIGRRVFKSDLKYIDDIDYSPDSKTAELDMYGLIRKIAEELDLEPGKYYVVKLTRYKDQGDIMRLSVHGECGIRVYPKDDVPNFLKEKGTNMYIDCCEWNERVEVEAAFYQYGLTEKLRWMRRVLPNENITASNYKDFIEAVKSTPKHQYM